MSGILLITVINASVFSISGLGEDLSVFRVPFTHIGTRAHVEFTLKPEFNILNKGSDLRSLFWTNPFNFSLAAPVTKGFIIDIGNCERFNQSFDLYFEDGSLNMHLVGEGGIEEVYATLSNNFQIGEIAFRGSYLFGNSSEVWNYYIGNYTLVDSFLYEYQGKVFSGGLRIKFISISYECFGDIIMEKQETDTTIELPCRLSIGLSPEIFDGKTEFLFEQSFWSEVNNDYRSPYRFKVGFAKERYGVSYMFNPWYLKDIVEHRIVLSYNMPIQRLGFITLNLGCALRNKGELREFTILPEIKLTIQEIFARRRK